MDRHNSIDAADDFVDLHHEQQLLQHIEDVVDNSSHMAGEDNDSMEEMRMVDYYQWWLDQSWQQQQ
jgi:hypothetical protein